MKHLNFSPADILDMDLYEIGVWWTALYKMNNPEQPQQVNKDVASALSQFTS